jgi:hypothetical protein
MAGVNSILVAQLGDVSHANRINSEVLFLLAAREVFADHPALMQIDNINGLATNTIKVPHLDLMGTHLPAATGDGSAVGNTAINNASSTVTVTRQSQAFGKTGLAGVVSNGVFDPSVFAMNAVIGMQLRLVELIVPIIAGFAATSGISGQDLDTATFLGAAGATRVLNIQSQLLGVLHGQQWLDLSIDMGTAVGGTTANSGAAHEQATRLMPTGDQGHVLGVDLVTNNRVATATGGADYAGGIFGRGAVLWSKGTPQVEIPALQTLIGDLLFELDRTARSDETAYVSHAYLGASKGLEAGVTLKSDAG